MFNDILELKITISSPQQNATSRTHMTTLTLMGLQIEFLKFSIKLFSYVLVLRCGLSESNVLLISFCCCFVFCFGLHIQNSEIISDFIQDHPWCVQGTL